MPPSEISPASDILPQKYLISNKTLVLVRWMAVLGQSMAIFVTEVFLAFDLPTMPVAICIFLSVAVNIFARIQYGNRSIPPLPAWLFMAFDILQLSALLWFTGGIHNPFVMMILAPACVGATLLPLRYTLMLIVLALTCVWSLSFFSIPLNWKTNPEDMPFPSLYNTGLLMAISISLLFICLYIWRISSESRALNRAYQISQLVLARHQEVSSLGALSAAAAHELGSPLSTISVISKDLKNMVSGDETTSIGEVKEDIALLNDQADKCRQILQNLGQSSTDKLIRDLDELTPPALIKALADQYLRSYPDIRFEMDVPENEQSRKIHIPKTPEIDFGIGNILQNAFKFARKHVRIELRTQNDILNIIVKDDGPGFSNAILRNIGEPYILQDLTAIDSFEQTNLRGMGLGIFIAQTLLEKTGASFKFQNRENVRGAKVIISIPLKQIESLKPNPENFHKRINDI